MFRKTPFQLVEKGFRQAEKDACQRQASFYMLRAVQASFSYTQNSQSMPFELKGSLSVCFQSGRESRLGK